MFNEKAKTQSLAGINAFLMRTYALMFLNILVSAASSYITGKYMPALATSTAFGWGSLILIIAFAVVFNHVVLKNPTAGFILMLAYSYLIGMSLSSLFFVYTKQSIAGAFISASALFAGLAFYGWTTKRSLASIGAYLFAGFIAAFITQIVNMFLGNGGLQNILNWIFLIIFIIYAAYDSNQLKQMYYQISDQRSLAALAIIGALNFYVDFVNIFIEILNLVSDNN